MKGRFKMNSLWIDSIGNKKKFSKLNSNIEADVCIVGAGIFGLTCGYYLSKLGYNVVIVDKSEIGHKATGHTTAKITSQHGLFYDYLKQSYGIQFAKDYLNANEEAIEDIKNIIDAENIKCDFNYENSFLYTTKKSEISVLKKEFKTLQDLDFNCEYVTKAGLPFEIEGSICFKNQSQFHPLKYLYGLCDSITKQNGHIYTNTCISDIKNFNDYFISYSNDFEIKSEYVIVGTHYPFINFPGFYFTKMYQSTSYLIAVDTKKTLFNGMYINISDPIFSFRTAKLNGKDLLLVGGAEHKTGHPSCYKDTYGILEEEVRKYYPNCEVLYRWNTRDCISLDKIPYVGSYSSSLPNMFVGTGFKKWGMTSSTVAANIIVDNITGKQNKYSYLFDSSRLKPIKNFDEFKNMMVQSTNSLLLDKFKRANMKFDDIQNNSGFIVEINNEKVGIYKDENGSIYAVKPICTHLGCLLSWNDIDKTWDCPCHGSRFDFKGKNLYDPAFKDLEIFDLTNS